MPMSVLNTLTGDGLIGAGANLLGSVANLFGAKSSADKAFERQKELMSLQQQYAVENWNREANYNDPKAQMQRLKSAGLNPNLVYGNGAAGLEAPSTAAPTAPAAPMAPASPADFGSVASSTAQFAKAMSDAKKAGSEALRQDIENKYLDQRYQNELAQQVAALELTQEQKKEIEIRIPFIAKQTAALQVEMDATKTRLGYEAIDRYISQFDVAVKAALAKNKIDDDTATRSARIFSLCARGRLDDANAYLVGLFKNPKQFRKFLTDWKDMLVDLWNNAEGKDSEGRSGLNPFNNNPKSPAAKAARAFFMGLDDWISSFLGTPQPWKD